MTDENGIDVEARQKQVAEILATPADKPVRAPRSDKGTKRPLKPAAAPAQPGAITLIVTIDQARKLAMALAAPDADLASFIQDQIIKQLQKRIASLTAQVN